jgi:hypothetical protein
MFICFIFLVHRILSIDILLEFRQGFALGIASLAKEMLLTSHTIDRILECLFKLITINNQSQLLIKQRRDTLIAMCNLYESLHDHHLSPFTQQELISKYLNCFLRCTRDYTHDRLGDSCVYFDLSMKIFERNII